MRQNPCVECGAALTSENLANKDWLAIYCAGCRAKYPEWHPICTICGTGLVQRKDNLFKMDCPLGCIIVTLIPKCN